MVAAATSDGAENVDRIFEPIDGWARAFRGRTFHYFGVIAGSKFKLCAARIPLQVRRPPSVREMVTGRFRAGVIAISGGHRRERVPRRTGDGAPLVFPIGRSSGSPGTHSPDPYRAPANP